MVEIDESACIERALRGDPEAFGELVRAHGRAVYNLALRMLGNHEDARDVAQVSFLKAWEKLSTFDSHGHFFSWIYRIAINESLNHRRRRRAFESLDPGMPSDEPGPEETAERYEETRRVQTALLELRPDDRQVLVMRHFLQLSHCEIGEVLQVPDKTVKSRLHEARTRLEAVLRRRGFGAP